MKLLRSQLYKNLIFREHLSKGVSFVLVSENRDDIYNDLKVSTINAEGKISSVSFHGSAFYR